MKQSTPLTTVLITEQAAARQLRQLRHVLERGDHGFGPVDADQIPVNPHLAFEADVGVLMGWPPAATEGIRKARNALLLSLRRAAAIGCEGIHYSRNRNEFSRRKHNHPDYWTYAKMRAAVDSLLTRPDLVCELRARPQNPYAPTATRHRSVLVTGPKFIDALVGAPLDGGAVTDHGERILLRDRQRKSLIIPAGTAVDETTRFLTVFDAAVTDLNFSFSDPEIMPLSATLSVANIDGWKIFINTDRRFFTRIFTGSMQDGGRFYRTFWQEIPKAMRRSLLIDGAPTAEHDYSACHLRLAYFAVGQQLPTSTGTALDHYTLDGFGPEWRTVIKKGVSILLNARTFAGAVGAIASVEEMPPSPWEHRVEVAITLVAAIKKRHEALAPLWHSGCGLGLQYVDSQLVIACATELISRGIVPLPIHDSMLVRAEHLPDLSEVMERHFEEDGPRLAADRFKALVNTKRRRLCGNDLTLGRTTASVLRALAPRSSSLSSVPSFDPPSVPTVATPPSSDSPLDLSRLRRHALIVDLERIVAHRAWVNGGIARSVLLTAMALYPDRVMTVRVVRAWVDLIVDQTAAVVDHSRLEHEVARFIRRAPRPISAASIARLCGVNATMAAGLGLAFVVPQARTAPLSRRIKRMRSTLPRIINIENAAPWGDPSKRASWFAGQRNPVDRQVLALRAILATGDELAIASARASIARAARERSSLAETQLPVDRLLHRLQMEITVHDLKWVPGDTRAADVKYDLADSRMFISCKTIRQSGESVQTQANRMRALMATFTDQPIQILTL
jgi:hypothetical protein